MDVKENLKGKASYKTANLVAGIIAGAGAASLALILLTRASRAQDAESVDHLLHQCDNAADKLDNRISSHQA